MKFAAKAMNVILFLLCISLTGFGVHGIFQYFYDPDPYSNAKELLPIYIIFVVICGIIPLYFG